MSCSVAESENARVRKNEMEIDGQWENAEPFCVIKMKASAGGGEDGVDIL